MIASLVKDIKKKKSNLLKSDFNKYLIDKNQITEYPKRLWFKGSRHREFLN